MRAKDITTSPVHPTGQDATVPSTAQVTTAGSVTGAPVRDPDGALVGLVGERGEGS